MLTFKVLQIVLFVRLSIATIIEIVFDVLFLRDFVVNNYSHSMLFIILFDLDHLL